LAGLALAGVAVAPTALSAQAGEDTPRDTIDVFFLGNSYVYYNTLPAILEGFGSGLESGPVIRTGFHLHGGFSLRRHLDDGHLPDSMAVPAPGDGAWEHAVIQEHSRLGVSYSDPERGTLGSDAPFQEAVDEAIGMARGLGMEPLLYMTWAKEAFPDQIGDLAEAYGEAGERNSVPVAPVGLAWDRVRIERPDLSLFTEDGSHPNPVGSYLAASVIYATLTGRSPVGAPASARGRSMTTPGVHTSDGPVTLVDLDPELAGYLQRVAREVVQSYR
jgi:hypothetical protein